MKVNRGCPSKEEPLMKKPAGRIHVLAVIMLVLSLMAGCTLKTGKVTRENFDKLKYGMTYEAAVAILGEPQDFSSRFGVRQYTWTSGERQIHAKFLWNRAIYFSNRGLEKVVPTT
jgi:outer membrane protein assembly factor BamE (lipoprotein component of BamABCDE complex)